MHIAHKRTRSGGRCPPCKSVAGGRKPGVSERAWRTCGRCPPCKSVAGGVSFRSYSKRATCDRLVQIARSLAWTSRRGDFDHSQRSPKSPAFAGTSGENVRITRSAIAQRHPPLRGHGHPDMTTQLPDDQSKRCFLKDKRVSIGLFLLLIQFKAVINRGTGRAASARFQSRHPADSFRELLLLPWPGWQEATGRSETRRPRSCRRVGSDRPERSRRQWPDLAHQLQDPRQLMPPPKSNRRLSAEQKRSLSDGFRKAHGTRRTGRLSHPRRPDHPAVKRGDWVRNPIDRLRTREARGRRGFRRRPRPTERPHQAALDRPRWAFRPRPRGG